MKRERGKEKAKNVRCMTSIREDFSGASMWDHRQDLLKHLDHVLEQLDLGLEYLQQYKPSLNVGDIQSMKGRYGRLKKNLLEVDGQARVTPTGRLIILFSDSLPLIFTEHHSTFSCSIPPMCP